MRGSSSMSARTLTERALLVRDHCRTPPTALTSPHARAHTTRSSSSIVNPSGAGRQQPPLPSLQPRHHQPLARRSVDRGGSGEAIQSTPERARPHRHRLRCPTATRTAHPDQHSQLPFPQTQLLQLRFLLPRERRLPTATRTPTAVPTATSSPTPAPTSTVGPGAVIILPAADARVDESQPSLNRGTGNTLPR